jgi:hypothetical protein
MTEPKSTHQRHWEPKEMLMRAAVDVPLATVSFGLGYGIARTALESMLVDPRGPGTLREMLPTAFGAAAAYAGLNARKALLDRDEARNKRRQGARS